jgi:5-(carboxyamino)imidazole ribonucleotide synthase
VGVIGAGQLARMMAEAASAMGIELVVLATSVDDGACATASRTVVGQPDDVASLENLAAAVDVITLDHELVDLSLLGELAKSIPVYPSPTAVRFASHKDHQRRAMVAAGVAVPRHLIVDVIDPAAVRAFCESCDGVVVKAATGGYDGRGVAVAHNVVDAMALIVEFNARGPVVVEERLELLGEFAALIVTDTEGHHERWPLVRTIQRDGMCAETQFPAGLDTATELAAMELADLVASVVNAVGVLAVELFLTSRGWLLNEVATRPHNSGHWTIEGATTSQFENHLRAVAGLPLGATTTVASAVAMVNVVGHQPGDLTAALAVPGVHVHDYGKAYRAGRKLGHVTVVGDDLEGARVRAWKGAEALGTFPKETS